jgi:hypothetical protein
MKKVWGSGLVFAFVLVLGMVSISLAVQLTPEEEAGLIQMREEEKLARDVYIEMCSQWGGNVFCNIKESEQSHMDAILKMLTKYGVPDPVAKDESGNIVAGKFTNPEIQKIYDCLIEMGSVSLQDAICVGVIIEEMDIEDIDKLLDGTEKPDLQRVYTNLINGSYNHLKSFRTNRAYNSGTCGGLADFVCQ